MKCHDGYLNTRSHLHRSTTLFKKYVMVVSLLLLALPASVNAVSFTFNATSADGITATDIGPDTINGANLAVGDDFTLDLQATGTNFWTINAQLNFPWGSFAMSEAATRNVDYTATFFLNGGQVAQDSQIAISQSNVHFGADRDFAPATPLNFDQLVITATLNASTSVSNTIGSNPNSFFIFSSNLGVFNPNEVSYTVGNTNPAPIPEPGTILLLSTGLLGLAGYRWSQRRREGTQVG